MNKGIIISLIVILAIVLFGSGVYFLSSEIQISKYDCNDVKDERVKDWCLRGKAIELESSCENRRSEKDFCYATFAIGKQDIFRCAKIQDPQSVYLCYLGIAVIKQDTAVCDNTETLDFEFDEIAQPDVKYVCYADVAIEKDDLSICEIIQNQLAKGFCYGKFANERLDPSLCGKIQNQLDRNDCYKSIAIEKKDPSICDKIDVEGTRNICYQYSSN